MKLRKRRMLLLREQSRAMNASGAGGSKARQYGVAPVIHALVVVLLLVGCHAGGGVPGNPIGIMTQWFSFLDGDSIRDGCRPGAVDRYRLIYNAGLQEQFRFYDVPA